MSKSGIETWREIEYAGRILRDARKAALKVFANMAGYKDPTGVKPPGIVAVALLIDAFCGSYESNLINSHDPETLRFVEGILRGLRERIVKLSKLGAKSDGEQAEYINAYISRLMKLMASLDAIIASQKAEVVEKIDGTAVAHA